MFKDDGKKHIPGDKPIEISLGEALKEVTKFPTVDEYDGGFVGFINAKGETIQFLRFSKNEWLLDVPILKEGVYDYSSQANLTMSEVKDAVTRFFQNKKWKHLYNLKK